MKKKTVNITKASGERVPFSEEKLENSLRRSGASEEQVGEVVREIRKELYEGMGTGKIYRKAFDKLRKKSRSQAARYKLKKAIMELGPSGYPFEHFVAALLEQQGFQTRVGMVIQGRCVSHEIDIIALKNEKKILAECKFHNRPGVKCSVRVPLYIHSRFRDVTMGFETRALQRSQANITASAKDPAQKGKIEQPYPHHARKGVGVGTNRGQKSDFDLFDTGESIEYEGWIVTNTRFTEDAIQYGTCSGLLMLGWDYPKKNSLKQRIEASGLHPVTCLSSLRRKEKEYLLDKGLVLCRKVLENKHILDTFDLSSAQVKKVLRECEELVYDRDVPMD